MLGHRNVSLGLSKVVLLLEVMHHLGSETLEGAFSLTDFGNTHLIQINLDPVLSSLP